MANIALKFITLVFIVAGAFLLGYAGNEDFNAVQSFGSLFLGLVCMIIAGIFGALTSTPATE